MKINFAWRNQQSYPQYILIWLFLKLFKSYIKTFTFTFINFLYLLIDIMIEILWSYNEWKISQWTNGYSSSPFHSCEPFFFPTIHKTMIKTKETNDTIIIINIISLIVSIYSFIYYHSLSSQFSDFATPLLLLTSEK